MKKGYGFRGFLPLIWDGSSQRFLSDKFQTYHPESKLCVFLFKGFQDSQLNVNPRLEVKTLEICYNHF